VALGYDNASAFALILKSIEVAVEARIRYMSSHPDEGKPMIAASVGPYGAYLADGSEYRGDYEITNQELTDFHQTRMMLLDSSSADILACETIPSVQEAEVLSNILKNTTKQAWISFSCKDGKHISDGTAIEDCSALFADHPNVFAIGVNCTSPQYISELIQCIKVKSGAKKIIVYPNSGAVYNADTKTWSHLTGLSSCETMVKEWIDLGADIIGGCCGIGPDQIKAMGKIVYQ
jgi:homocysteine S-methyltransferase